MKTAISLPDELFDQAERFARKQGISRSELFASALKKYLDERSGDAITRAIDAVYANESSNLDPAILRTQARVIGEESW